MSPRKVLKCSDSFEISVEQGGYGNPELYVYIDGFAFATIEELTMDRMDEESIVKYVRENHDLVNFRTSAYHVPRIGNYNYIRQ